MIESIVSIRAGYNEYGVVKGKTNEIVGVKYIFAAINMIWPYRVIVIYTVKIIEKSNSRAGFNPNIKSRVNLVFKSDSQRNRGLDPATPGTFSSLTKICESAQTRTQIRRPVKP